MAVERSVSVETQRRKLVISSETAVDGNDETAVSSGNRRKRPERVGEVVRRSRRRFRRDDLQIERVVRGAGEVGSESRIWRAVGVQTREENARIGIRKRETGNEELPVGERLKAGCHRQG